jgi:hypothetical protein
MKTYEISDRMREQIANNFTYHKPNPDQPERYMVIRDKARDLAELILKLTPPSREQSVAITELESTVMWANAAIARNEGAEPE